MTLAELISQFRTEVDDNEASDYLWSTDEIKQYLDEAQKSFVRATNLITDVSNASVTEAAVTADQKFVDISPLVTKVRRARLTTLKRVLKVVNFNEMDLEAVTDDYGSVFNGEPWELETGDPQLLVLDMETDKGRLVPIPTDNDTLKMTVYRLPLTNLTDDAEPEVTDVTHQRVTLHYAKYLAYNKQDAEVYNPNVAEEFRGRFLQGVAEYKSETKRKRRRPGTVRYGGL